MQTNDFKELASSNPWVEFLFYSNIPVSASGPRYSSGYFSRLGRYEKAPVVSLKIAWTRHLLLKNHNPNAFLFDERENILSIW